MAAVGRLKVEIYDNEGNKIPTPPPSPRNRDKTDDKVQELMFEIELHDADADAEKSKLTFVIPKDARPKTSHHARVATPHIIPKAKAKDDSEVKEDK